MNRVERLRQIVRAGRAQPAGAALVGSAAILVTLVGGYGAYHWPASLSSLHEWSAQNESRSAADREIGARYLDISREFLFAARALIPPDDRYAVLTGDGVRVSSPITLSALPNFAGYFLLPRRQVDPSRASWLLCYGCDPPQSGVRLVWKSRDGMIFRIGS